MRDSIRRRWALPLLTALAALPVGAQDSPHRLLQQRVTRVAANVEWGMGQYYWLSNQEALTFQEVTGSYQATLIRYNVQTGVTTPLPALSKLYNAADSYPYAVKVSPDGRRMIWPTAFEYRGAQLDGSHFFSVPYSPDEDPAIIQQTPPRNSDYCWLGACGQPV